MSEQIHGLAQLLPGKSSLHDCNLEELRQLAKRYPYFAPAQFLLLQKLKETGSPEYEAHYQKAVLYYPDPLQFDFFVSAEKFRFTEDDANEATPTPFPLHELDAVLPSDEALAAEEQQTMASTDKTGVPDFVSEETHMESAPLLNSNTPSNAAVFAFQEPDKSSLDGEADTPEPAVLLTQPFHDKVSSDKEKLASEKDALVSLAPAAIEDPVLTSMPADGASLPVDMQPKADAANKNDAVKTVQPATDTLTFEPYYTVDYFASQGIKITSDNLPKDKLSKQLRSFTEWLKVMKRLPAAELQQATQSPAEKNVENLASHSVAGDEVVTEAMAEVWAKQGAREKAIETYNKLSLLNPSKMAYFAAKIENLSRS